MQEIFSLYGWKVNSYAPINQGLINSTYSIQTNTGNYILQSINHKVFKSPTAIDENINAISKYLQKHLPNYLFTHLVPTLNGNTLVNWEGAYYRAFHKIEGYALSVLENENQVEQAAMQFAGFTSVLKNFEASQLKDSLPDFHNLTLRYEQFALALKSGNQDRILQSASQIKFLQDHKWIADFFETIKANPNFKLRATHHDTKISNLLFDDHDKGICVIDLDTLMPGYFISDLGDMFRTYLCAVSEEETDFSKISVRPSIYKAIVQGYLKGASNMLSKDETDHVYYAGLFMIYMQALRFLTDYINDDVYYGSKYPLHNYNRACNQIKLLEDYLQKEEILQIEINK